MPRRKAGIDFHPQALGLDRQPFAEIGEADRVIALIGHQRRHQEMRQPDRAPRGVEIETVVGDLCLERRALLFPVGDQLVQRARIDDGAGEDMRSDLGAFFQQTDADLTPRLRRQLFQLYCRRQAGGTAADNDDVIVHAFTLDRLAHGVFYTGQGGKTASNMMIWARIRFPF